MDGSGRDGGKRIIGVDLLRCIAALGVVFIHAGLVTDGSVTARTVQLQALFSVFCVPFFLAASFYFSAVSIAGAAGSFRKAQAIQKTFSRLLIPYAVWTGIYTGAQMLKQIARHSGDMSHVLSDPLGRLLFGCSGVMLYFLPLLVAGLTVFQLCGPALMRMGLLSLTACFCLSIVAAEAVVRSGNQFTLDGNAFHELLRGLAGGLPWTISAPIRVIAVLLAHLVRCAPYALGASISARFLVPLVARHRSTAVATVALSAAFLAAGILAADGIPEVIVGFSGVLFAVGAGACLSMEPAPWISRVGEWSFGIFLSHQLILELMQMMLKNRLALPAGPMLTFALAIAAFSGAFFLTELADFSDLTSLRAAFGLRARRRNALSRDPGEALRVK